MFKLSVKNDKGEALSLTDNPNYNVYQIKGLNPPSVTLHQSANTAQDGSIISSSRVDVRNIVINLSIEGDVEANRINLYKFFPAKRVIKLFFSNGSRNVSIDGMVEKLECDLFVKKQVAQISILCPKPFFRDVDELITTFSDITGNFSFPFAIEKEGIEISAITTNIRRSIINSGDVESGLIIELFAAGGDVVEPIIYDVFEKTFFSLNMNIYQGELIRINTNSGEKSITRIRNGVESNAMGYLNPNSTWLTLKSGDNVFTYDCFMGGSNLQITFKNSVLYTGV